MRRCHSCVRSPPSQHYYDTSNIVMFKRWDREQLKLVIFKQLWIFRPGKHLQAVAYERATTVNSVPAVLHMYVHFAAGLRIAK